MAVELDEYFTTGEVRDILGISLRSVQNYCDTGKLKCEQASLTKYRRIHRDSLISFMKENNIPLERIKARRSVKFLVVDDEPAQVEIVSDMIREMFGNAVIETAGDGYEGCVKAGIFVPDIVILDLIMPKADGFEVCRSIRKVEKTRRAEIIIVSVLDDKATQDKLKEFNVYSILKKPFSRQDFLQAVHGVYSKITG